MQKLSPRKYRSSIRMVPMTVCNQVVIVYVTDDLTNQELQEHFNRAFQKNDFEYCHALSAEASNRNIKLTIHAD